MQFLCGFYAGLFAAAAGVGVGVTGAVGVVGIGVARVFPALFVCRAAA